MSYSGTRWHASIVLRGWTYTAQVLTMLFLCPHLGRDRTRIRGTILWPVVRPAIQRSAIDRRRKLEWNCWGNLKSPVGFYISIRGQKFGGNTLVVQCKIQDWQLKLKQRDCRIYIYKGDKEIKSVKTRIFKERVLLTLPKELYKLITQDITAANIFEKYMNKFWKWDEKEDCWEYNIYGTPCSNSHA